MTYLKNLISEYKQAENTTVDKKYPTILSFLGPAAQQLFLENSYQNKGNTTTPLEQLAQIVREFSEEYSKKLNELKQNKQPSLEKLVQKINNAIKKRALEQLRQQNQKLIEQQEIQQRQRQAIKALILKKTQERTQASPITTTPTNPKIKRATRKAQTSPKKKEQIYNKHLQKQHLQQALEKLKKQTNQNGQETQGAHGQPQTNTDEQSTKYTEEKTPSNQTINNEQLTSQEKATKTISQQLKENGQMLQKLISALY